MVQNSRPGKRDLNGSAQRLPGSVPAGCHGSGKTAVPDHPIRRPALRRTHAMPGPIGVNEFAAAPPPGRAVSLLGSGVIVRLAGAVGLAVLLWVAAAWAMDWLP
jgi:hypothetical protein